MLVDAVTPLSPGATPCERDHAASWPRRRAGVPARAGTARGGAGRRPRVAVFRSATRPTRTERPTSTVVGNAAPWRAASRASTGSSPHECWPVWTLRHSGLGRYVTILENRTAVGQREQCRLCELFQRDPILAEAWDHDAFHAVSRSRNRAGTRFSTRPEGLGSRANLISGTLESASFTFP